ncbi:DNA gyrase inhibitor YacG [Ralstonia solanacearum]|nr:DNA gyrase inhibitor YacG [Ralstonia solanacearum]
MNMKTVKCPTCGKPVPWTPESRYRPFCSERCKQIDLGAWAAEQYTIPVVEDDDLPSDAPGGESGGASGRLN